jgi:cytidine deaminase
MPCGACRQLLAEYAPKAMVWVADSARPGRVRTFRVAALLPEAFRKVPRRPA